MNTFKCGAGATSPTPTGAEGREEEPFESAEEMRDRHRRGLVTTFGAVCLLLGGGLPTVIILNPALWLGVLRSGDPGRAHAAGLALLLWGCAIPVVVITVRAVGAAASSRWVAAALMVGLFGWGLGLVATPWAFMMLASPLLG